MILTQKSDLFGAWASGLCLIHCVATPFIFVVQACSSSCCESTPLWWSSIDYLFAGISFFAVYFSARNTSKQWVKYGMWATWGALLSIILNEKFTWMHLPHEAIYVPAVSLVFLHLYNRRYCKCGDEACEAPQYKAA